MTEGEVGDRYAELGGQLPDEPERERGKRRIADLKAALNRKDTTCPDCGHGMRLHGPQGGCYAPIAPRGLDCGCGRKDD